MSPQHPSRAPKLHPLRLMAVQSYSQTSFWRDSEMRPKPDYQEARRKLNSWEFLKRTRCKAFLLTLRIRELPRVPNSRTFFDIFRQCRARDTSLSGPIVVF